MNRTLLLLLTGFAAVVAAGCGPPPLATYDSKTVDGANQMRKVGAAFNQAYQRNRRPPTAEELKPFLRQVGDADALLVSPRDGKRLVIVSTFSPDITPNEGEESIVAYEQDGADGKRLTVDFRGTVVAVTDAEFEKLKFVGGHKPTGR